MSLTPEQMRQVVSLSKGRGAGAAQSAAPPQMAGMVPLQAQPVYQAQQPAYAPVAAIAGVPALPPGFVPLGSAPSASFVPMQAAAAAPMVPMGSNGVLSPEELVQVALYGQSPDMQTMQHQQAMGMQQMQMAPPVVAQPKKRGGLKKGTGFPSSSCGRSVTVLMIAHRWCQGWSSGPCSGSEGRRRAQGRRCRRRSVHVQDAQAAPLRRAQEEGRRRCG
jgi:hypothetical protein